MNNTNRGLNRLFSFIVGLVLIALGATAAAVAFLAPVRSGWSTTAPDVEGRVAEFARGLGSLAGTTVTWWRLALIAVLALAIVLLLVFIFRQGHGHTSTWIRERDAQLVVESALVEQLLQGGLAARSDVVASHVSTYAVHGTPVLKIAATARRGVSPVALLDGIERALAAAGAIVGRPAAASVQISGGFRANASRATRLDLG